MKIFVISLERSVERRATIDSQLKKLKLEYEFFDAVDGNCLAKSEVILNTRKLNYAIEPGEIGCSLSHISIYAKIAAENISSALILEDDAILHDELPFILKEMELKIQKKPRITILTPINQYIATPVDTIIKKYNTHHFIEGTGAYGYVVNNSAAHKLIEFLYPVWLVSDRWQFILENSVCDIDCLLPPVISHPPYLENELHKISTIHQDLNLSGLKATIWRQIKKRRSLRVKFRRMIWLCFMRKFLSIRKFRN